MCIYEISIKGFWNFQKCEKTSSFEKIKEIITRTTINSNKGSKNFLLINFLTGLIKYMYQLTSSFVNAIKIAIRLKNEINITRINSKNRAFK